MLYPHLTNSQSNLMCMIDAHNNIENIKILDLREVIELPTIFVVLLQQPDQFVVTLFNKDKHTFVKIVNGQFGLDSFQQAYAFFLQTLQIHLNYSK